MSKAPSRQVWLTTAQVGQMLDPPASRQHVRNWILSGAKRLNTKLKAKQFGPNYMVEISDLRRFAKVIGRRVINGNSTGTEAKATDE